MCPFCYIGNAQLDQALEQFPHSDSVTVRYHSFLLMPHLPADSAIGLNELLAAEKGFPPEQAAAMNAQVAERGQSVGLDFAMDQAVATNMRTAHRLIHFAGERSRQHDLVQRLFRAYFAEGLNVGDHQVLADLAQEVGLDRPAALTALESGAFDQEVEADLRQARELGISGVPFFVFHGKYAVSGAQPVEAFLQALETTWNELDQASGQVSTQEPGSVHR